MTNAEAKKIDLELNLLRGEESLGDDLLERLRKRHIKQTLSGSYEGLVQALEDFTERSEQ
jgi:hypothetical protein